MILHNTKSDCLKTCFVFFLDIVMEYVSYTLISCSHHFEIERKAPVGRTPEVQINNNALDLPYCKAVWKP